MKFTGLKRELSVLPPNNLQTPPSIRTQSDPANDLPRQGQDLSSQLTDKSRYTKTILDLAVMQLKWYESWQVGLVVTASNFKGSRMWLT